MLKEKTNISQRTRNVMLNSLASGMMKICSLACSLIIVPITIDYLNPENYGLWMAITSILYWIAFCDIGLGNGMRNYLAQAFSLGDKAKMQSYFSTAMVILTMIALALGVVTIPMIYMLNLNEVFNTHSIDGRLLAHIVSVAVAFSLMQFVTKNIGVAYIAMQKYAISDFISFLGNVCSVLLVYILTQTTEGNLMYVVATFTGIPVLMYILAAIPLLREHPELSPSIRNIDWKVAQQIATKGLGFFAIQISSCLVIFGSANVFISHYCGPEQVTVYNVAYKVFNILIIAYTILIAPLWNAYTDAATKEDYAWIKKTFGRSLMMWVLTVIGGIVLLSISAWIYKLWIGEEVEVPFSVSLCVFAYVSVFNLNNCLTYLINGLNRIRIQIITSIAATVIYLIAVLLIRDNYGIEGISLAMVVSYLLMTTVHFYQCYLFVNNKAKGIWNK